jgi:hypothetical protein
MKILYLSVYRDGTGWAEAANRYILALDAAGVEVVPRPIRLEAVSHTPSDRVLELEKRSSKGCNVVIQQQIAFCIRHGPTDLVIWTLY